MEKFIGPEALELLPGLMILAEKANFAKENKDLELLTEAFSQGVSQFEIFIQFIDIPELTDDLDSLLIKLKELVNELDQGNGSFEKVQIFDLVVLELVAKVVATFNSD